MALAAWALLTLQDAKDHLSVSVNEFDAVIEGMVESATLLCEEEVDRQIASRTYSEVYDGTGCLSLKLRQYPVTAVSSVSFQAWPSTSEAQDTTTHGLYIVQPIQESIAFRDLYFPRGSQNVTVAYTAGLTTIPKAIKDACRIALKALWDVRDKQNAGIVSQSYPGGQTVVYDRAALPQMFRTLLQSYRRCAWV